MNSVCSFLLTIFDLPWKLLNLPRFVRERKSLYADFKIGDWVRLKETENEIPVVIAMKDASGILREIKPPVFVPTTAEHFFFTEHEPFEVTKVFIMPIAMEVHTYLKYRNCDQDHPCTLMLRNPNVRFGKNTLDFAPGSLVEKVQPPPYASKPQ